MIVTFFPNQMEVEFLIRLGLTCVCGLLVGIERTRQQKAAGMRTYLIVAIGACVYAIVSKYGFVDVVGKGAVHVDVSRVCSSIVSGVGFLGAGTIFMREDRIEGLSTSAGIWGIAAVGTAIGIGMYFPAVATTVIILLVQVSLHTGGKSFFDVKGKGRIVIDIDDKMSSLRQIEKIMEERNIDILYTEMEVHKDHQLTYRFRVNLPEGLNIAETATQIYRETNAKSIDI
ncbi:MAG: MgtC/SapB family protein [Lachnospiraceae bacterium]|jgi:putative Mg2+ transporter-C (MgtC) family protein|nr:MgtC/SapB family protein [Lachnospiraceae bacterium]